MEHQKEINNMSETLQTLTIQEKTKEETTENPNKVIKPETKTVETDQENMGNVHPDRLAMMKKKEKLPYQESKRIKKEKKDNAKKVDRSQNYRQNDRPTDRTDNRSNNRPSDRMDDKSNYRPVERPYYRPTDRPDSTILDKRELCTDLIMILKDKISNNGIQLSPLETKTVNKFIAKFE